MGRRTLTVPTAGQTKPFQLTGKSIIVLQAPSQNRLVDFAELSLDKPGMRFPAKEGSTLEFNDGIEFNNVYVTGTTESAGDELVIGSVKDCLGTYINTNLSDTDKSIAGPTQTKAASDAVQSFTDVEIADNDGNLPKRLYIYVIGGATRGINYAFDVDPSQGDHATDSYYWDNDRQHEAAGDLIKLDPLEIVGIDWIQKFRFRATILGETPTLIWTPEY